MGENGGDDRPGTLGRATWQAGRHGVQGSGLQWVEGDGSGGKVYRFRGNPICRLLFLKKCKGKVSSERQEGGAR